MSQTLKNTIDDEVQRTYNAALLRIAYDLEKDQQEELRFYYNGIIKKGDTGALSILQSLENAGKTSWKDVRFLEEGLREVRRLDLAKILEEFEIKRDLTILLDFYATKKQDSEVNCRSASESVEEVAGYLLMLMTDAYVSATVRS